MRWIPFLQVDECTNISVLACSTWFFDALVPPLKPRKPSLKREPSCGEFQEDDSSVIPATLDEAPWYWGDISKWIKTSLLLLHATQNAVTSLSIVVERKWVRRCVTQKMERFSFEKQRHETTVTHWRWGVLTYLDHNIKIKLFSFFYLHWIFYESTELAAATSWSRSSRQEDVSASSSLFRSTRSCPSFTIIATIHWVITIARLTRSCSTRFVGPRLTTSATATGVLLFYCCMERFVLLLQQNPVRETEEELKMALLQRHQEHMRKAREYDEKLVMHTNLVNVSILSRSSSPCMWRISSLKSQFLVSIDFAGSARQNSSIGSVQGDH